MQSNQELNLLINNGAPVSAIPRNWFLFINNVLRYLTVRNGKLFINDDKWTIECDTGKFSALGTPGIYKVPLLRGYKKVTANDVDTWVLMTVAEELAQRPTKLLSEVTDTDTKCLQLTWDYIRFPP